MQVQAVIVPSPSGPDRVGSIHNYGLDATALQHRRDRKTTRTSTNYHCFRHDLRSPRSAITGW